MYAKVFRQIYDSTLAEDWRALVTFQQLLVLADEDGMVDMTLGAIHRVTNIPKDIIESGIAKLSEIDKYSLCKASGAQGVEIVATKYRIQARFHYPAEKRLPSDAWGRLRAAVFARDNYTCRYCGQYGGCLECDHVIPISRGGSNDISNLATACFSCNRSKRNKTTEEWRQ